MATRVSLALLLVVSVLVTLSSAQTEAAGYADLGLVNGNGEVAATTGWTGDMEVHDAFDDSGTTPHSGYYYLRGAGAYQDLPLAAHAAEVDSGRFTGKFGGWIKGGFSFVQIQWRNASGATIGRFLFENECCDWNSWSQILPAPPGARSVRFIVGIDPDDEWTDVDDLFAQFCTSPAAPAIGWPVNGSTTDASPNISWSPSTDTTGYDIEIAYDPGFTSLAYDQSVPASATSHRTIYALETGTKYYLRMRSVNACGAGPWSNTVPFMTRGHPPCPQPLAPALAGPRDSASVSTRPLVKWKSVLLADYYVAQVAKDAAFAKKVRIRNVPASQALEYLVNPALPKGTEFFWRVKAVNVCLPAKSQGAWSQVRDFRTRR